MPAKKPKKPARQKPGPEEERVKIDIPWEDAVKKSLGKKKPKEGWPEEEREETHDDAQ